VSRRSVITSTSADSEIESIGWWWAEHRSAQQAARWVDGILKAIEALENDRLPFDTRQLLFGLGRRPTHRVLFTIRPECVYVLTVLHVSQDAVDLERI
jgi:plasmid stabilization system protein ParE